MEESALHKNAFAARDECGEPKVDNIRFISDCVQLVSGAGLTYLCIPRCHRRF
jgi:hypothetical protein